MVRLHVLDSLIKVSWVRGHLDLMFESTHLFKKKNLIISGPPIGNIYKLIDTELFSVQLKHLHIYG